VLTKSAVIGTLLSSQRAMTIAEIIEAMDSVRPIGEVEQVLGPMTPKRLSDMLRFQTRQGLVRRVSRGCYEVVPERMSRTTRWRYRRWNRRFDEEIAQRRAWSCERHSAE
jgi:hypothetical protein